MKTPMAPLAPVRDSNRFPWTWVTLAGVSALPTILIGLICARCLQLWGEDFMFDVQIINDKSDWAPAFKPFEALWLGGGFIAAWVVLVIITMTRIAAWRREEP